MIPILTVLMLFVSGVAGAADRLNWTVAYEGKSVRVYVVTPPGRPPPWPMALVLHGASGIGSGKMIWPMADALAARGIAAGVVEYFDGLPSNIRRQSYRQFARRERILEHVAGALLARREIAGEKLGVYGFSSGGFHAIALAATDRRFAAAVSLAGGLSGHISRAALRRAAPLLLIHGTADRIVPYRRARIAHAAWRRAGREVRLLALSRVRHVPYRVVRDRVFEAATAFIADRLLPTALPPLPPARPDAETPVPAGLPAALPGDSTEAG